MIKAVIFDLDDTLYPEIDYIKNGFKAVSEQIKKDYNISCYDAMFKLFRQDKNNVYNKILDEYKINYDENYINKLVEIYRNRENEKLEFYNDVMPLLQVLKSKNIKIGIITDGRVAGQEVKLKALGCYELFDKIIITDSLGGIEYRKPHPKAFEQMQEFLQIDFAEMMYIGDNPQKDFAISAIHPILAVQIIRENGLYNNEDYLDNISASNIINSLDEVFKYLKVGD